MILVDTSVLIDFFKGSGTENSRKLEEILRRRMPFGITPYAMQEVLQGQPVKRNLSFSRITCQRNIFII